MASKPGRKRPVINLITSRVKVVSARHKEFIKRMARSEGRENTGNDLAAPIGLAGLGVILAARG